jgi:hypothetical protein
MSQDDSKLLKITVLTLVGATLWGLTNILIGVALFVLILD